MDLLGSCQVCGQFRLSDETSHNYDLSSTSVPKCQTKLFAGSDGSTTFNEHLRFYFVTRKLLHFSESQCLKFMMHMTDSNSNDSKSKSLLLLCDKCKNIVDEAAKLHMQLTALQYQIDKLSDILKRNVCSNKSGLFSKESEGLIYAQSGAQPKVEVVEDDQIDFDEAFDVDNFGGHFLTDTGDDGGDDDYEDIAIHDSSRQEEERSQPELGPRTPTATVTNVPEKTLQCELCESTYATLPGFRKHLRIHDESNALGNKFDCPRCRHPNLTKDALKCHITQVHEHAQKTCNICGHVSYKPWIHKNHMLTEHNVDANQTVTAEKEIFSCKLCASEYTSKQGFNKHKRYHEQSNLMGNKFDCQLCRHPCISKNSLAKHLTRSHSTNEDQKITPKIETPEDTVDKDLDDQTGILPLEEESFQEEKRLDEINTPVETRPLLRRRSTKITSYKVDNAGSDDDDADIDIRQDTKRRKKEDKDWESEEDQEESASASHDDSQESEPESDSSDSDFEIERKKRARTVRRAGEASSSRPKGDFICTICNNTYSCDRSLSRHMELHDLSRSMQNKYDCEKCGFPCNSENKLRYHKRKRHQEIAKLCCPVCPYEARRPVQLRNHMDKHNVPSQEIKRSHKKWSKYLPYMQPDGKFKCPSCESVFISTSAFCRHLREHDKTKLAPESFDCEECGFPCLSENKLQRHRTKVHGQPKSFKCSICNRSFKRPFMLEAHLQTHKQLEKARDPTTGSYRCFLCKSYEGSMQGIIVHLTQAHPDYVLEGSKLCPQCGQSFTTETILRRHIKNKHENIYRFRCETCFKGFESKNTLKHHQKTHEEVRTREFICDACGTAYSHSRTLANHVARFHPELSKADKTIKRKAVKRGQFKCKWCDMVFTYKYLLVSHMPSAHKDLYTFGCDLCSRTYISASSLKLHKEINHSDGSRSFSCKYCQKPFTHKHYVICHYNYCREKKKLDGSSSSIVPEDTHINNQNLTFQEESQQHKAAASSSSSNTAGTDTSLMVDDDFRKRESLQSGQDEPVL